MPLECPIPKLKGAICLRIGIGVWLLGMIWTLVFGAWDFNAMVITLIGYRGTGKTTLAAPLAARLGWEWLDADVELERRAGRSIQDIFATDGEPEFRRLERELLAELVRRDRLVIAAGGGAIGNESTRTELKAAGPVIWLQASVDTIERRLATDPTTGHRRPQLTRTGGRAEIERLLALREPLYRQCATITLDADSVSVEQLVSEVMNQLPMLIRRGDLRSSEAAGSGDPRRTPGDARRAPNSSGGAT
jgi:shikimate kinase